MIKLLLLNFKIKVGVRKWLLNEGKMPPFFPQGFEAKIELVKGIAGVGYCFTTSTWALPDFPVKCKIYTPAGNIVRSSCNVACWSVV